VKVHDFRDSMEHAAEYVDAPWWMAVYRTAFPDLCAAVSVRADGWAQRGGIDRVLTLVSGKTLTVDEKVREKDWPDIALEYWSDRDRRIPGWVAKDLACDFIAYAFVPSQTCHLLPFQALRRAWRLNHRKWVREYPKVEAQNKGWLTVSVAVPTRVLLSAISDAMTISWTHEERDRREADDDSAKSYDVAIREMRLARIRSGEFQPREHDAEELAAHAASQVEEAIPE
jgi:hypothetical protein